MTSCGSKSDKELLRLCLEDNEYFSCIVDRYEEKLKRYLRRSSRFDEQTCEDVLQEVFIKVYRYMNDYDEDYAFSSWIYRITHNELIDHVRKAAKGPVAMDLKGDEFVNYIEMIPGKSDLPQEYGKKELAALVRKSLFALPQKYREVLVLRFLEEKSYTEISDILKRSVGSVSVLINRAKDKLKNQLLSIHS